MKKIITLLLCGVILVSNIPGGVAAGKTAADGAVAAIAAGETLPSAAAKDSSDKGLENAIKAIKAKITIPKEYSKFDYYYNDISSYGNARWILSWRNPADNSYIQVECDQAYRITSYNKYSYNEKSGVISTYLKKELKEKAEAFIKQIAPEIASSLEFLSSDYEGIYSGAYVYQYQRIENGIIFPDNYVLVRVDSVSGEVTGATINWLYDAKIPSAKPALTQKEATAALKKHLSMKLKYRTNNYQIYDSVGNSDIINAFLIYEPNLSYVSVDAASGEVYLNRSEWIQKEDERNMMDNAKGAAEAKADSGGITLTEEELAKIKELESLISKEKAIELVTKNKSLYIDENLMSYNAYLSKSGGYGSSKSSYVWVIDLRDARPVDYEKDTDYYRAYANATVDAKTGKILSFYASVRGNYDEKTGKWNTVKIKYTKEKAQQILEAFLQSEINSRFKKTKLVDSREDYVAYYKENNTPVYGGYYFKYNRFNEDVEFEYNGIYGAVDGVTGKIYQYRSTWYDSVAFESTKSAMSADKALEAYLAKEGYRLVYEVNEVNIYDPNYRGDKKFYDDSEAYSVKYEVRLVYRPDINPPYISPFTGEQLNYDGSIYTKKEPIRYVDIEDKPENREILLLADMGIGFEGDHFYPNKDITVSEFYQLIKQIGYGYYFDDDSAKANNRSITREELAYMFIDKLGLGKLAAINGIYTTGYADESSIQAEYLGAVALSKGINLMGAEADNRFNPKDHVTRAEAVPLILSFIRVQRQGLY